MEGKAEAKEKEKEKRTGTNTHNDSVETYHSENSFPVSFNNIKRQNKLKESQYNPEHSLASMERQDEDEQLQGVSNRYLIEKIYEEDFPETSRRKQSKGDTLEPKGEHSVMKNTQEQSSENFFVTKEERIKSIYLSRAKTKFRRTVRSSLQNKEDPITPEIQEPQTKWRLLRKEKPLLQPDVKITSFLGNNKAVKSPRERVQASSFRSSRKVFPQVDLSQALNSMPRIQRVNDYSINFPKLLDSHREQSEYHNLDNQDSVFSAIPGIPRTERQHMPTRERLGEGEEGIRSFLGSFEPHTLMFDHIDLSEFKIKKYKNGVYIGQLTTDQRKHGLGIIFYHNGRLYEGQFHSDLKSGKGYELYNDASYYDGEYLEGYKSGKGRFVWSNGEIYDGEWLSGKKNGSGMWKANRESKQSYIGEWFNGKPHGFGVYINQIGDRYEGEFKDGLKQGHGTERFTSGDLYNGTFLKGRRHGEGEYRYSNGNTYQGEFSNNLKHGKGKYIQFETQQVYEGTYMNDNISGEGQYLFSNGTIYEGSFENNLIHGQGQVTYSDNSVNRGFWVNGIKVNEPEEEEGEMVKQFRLKRQERRNRLRESRTSKQILHEGWRPQPREVPKRQKRQNHFKHMSVQSGTMTTHTKKCGCLGHRRSS